MLTRKLLSIAIVSCMIWSSMTVFLASEQDSIAAEAYVMIEAKTETVILGENIDIKMAPASTTKILTAIIAIESAPLTRKMEVSEHAAGTTGSRIGLLSGEILTLKDLLYMLMLKSANDAAVVIAEGISGDVDKFADLMNRKAAEIGATNSNFTNPHGLPDEDHYTTAMDLSRITAYALRNKTFSEIVSSRTYKTDYHALALSNSNKLLHSYDYINGVKTGYTKLAGRCLVTAAEQEGVNLICVTLNDPDDWNDHIKMYEQGFKRVKATTLFEPYTYKCVRNILNGAQKGNLYNMYEINGIQIDGHDIYFEYREDIEPIIFAPVSAYKPLGYVTQMYGGKSVFRTEVCLISDIEYVHSTGTLEKIIHKIRNLFRTLL